MWDIYAMEILEEKKGKWTEEIFEIISTENFPNNYWECQTIDPGSSENTKQDKCPPKNYPGISYSNYSK